MLENSASAGGKPIGVLGANPLAVLSLFRCVLGWHALITIGFRMEFRIKSTQIESNRSIDAAGAATSPEITFIGMNFSILIKVIIRFGLAGKSKAISAFD